MHQIWRSKALYLALVHVKLQSGDICLDTLSRATCPGFIPVTIHKTAQGAREVSVSEF
jgi:hypothetical protein